MLDEVFIGDKKGYVGKVVGFNRGCVRIEQITTGKCFTVTDGLFLDQDSKAVRLSSTCNSSYAIKRFHFNENDYVEFAVRRGNSVYPLRNVGSHRLDINRQLGL